MFHSLGHTLGANQRVVEKETHAAFLLYLLYLVSFFLRLPARLPVLGVIRFDFLLVAAISFFIFSSKSTKGSRLDSASKYLLAIFVYSVITLPLVEWPGSVINNGMVAFIKGAIFYFFTVNLIVNDKRLKSVIAVFVICNLIRILEPLVLNITTGYLGSATHLGGTDFAGRLAGAPVDTINPNGLAFVIATVIPFIHYIFAPVSKKTFFIYLLLIPVLLYTMGLTLSRSGVLALGIIAFGIWLKSTHKFLLLVLGVVGLAVIFMNLNEVQKDRYLSIVSDDARQSSSAAGRIEGWSSDFRVAMNRPIIGHGLGTSREANWNVAGKDQISHILWAEIWQEIGLIGLILFILYLSAMIRNFREAARLIKGRLAKDDFLYRCTQAMQVWLLMNLLFSLASYGLKSYEWYLFGGLSVVLLGAVRTRITQMEEEGAPSKSTELAPVKRKFPLARRINHQN
ncbi:O-antigen ligase family protein [Marinobacter sp. HN1S83]|uniref:O-antigen ligase family protein n=1 Tax=Marinobacter sp. HN1S83 TaxID=3382301 RepID=UPI00387ADB47